MLTPKYQLAGRLRWFNVMLGCVIGYSGLLAFGNVVPLALYGVPGGLLVFYLPGRLLIDLYHPLQKPWGVIGRAALAIFLSVSMVATVQIFLNRFGINETTTILPVLGINIGLGALTIMQYWKGHKRGLEPVFANDQYDIRSLRDLWPLVAVFAVMGAAIVLNPYPGDADGFLSGLQKTVACHCVGVDFRPGFVSYQALIHLVLGWPIVGIYRMLFPMLFFVSTWFVFDYAMRNVSSKHLATVAYLSILAAPVVISEVNIIRPQVGMLAFTLPVLIISIEAWRRSSVLFVAIAGWFSLIAIGFHELSVLLLILALMPIGPIMWRVTAVEKRVTWKHLLLATVIVLPYLKLFSVQSYFSKLVNSIHLVLKLVPPVHWRWWFIDNYVTIDGFNLGWPGIQSVYYYAYSGALLLILTLGLLVWVGSGRKLTQRHIVIPMVYGAVFLVFAELLPRLGFFFLPNRAWVHLMLAVSVTLLLIYEQKTDFTGFARFITVFLPGVFIIIGVIGTLYVAGNNVAEIFREEIPSLAYVKGTTPKSLFISSQENRTLVQLYGGRAYQDILVDQKLDRPGFDHLVDQQIDKMQHGKVTTVPQVTQETKRFEDGKLVFSSTQVVQERGIVTIKPTYLVGTPVYFIYSIRKSSGVNAVRKYNHKLNDVINKDTYAFLGYTPVYSDGSVIILKLR